MTGRHAAPPDEAFDQLERERVGSHRADVELPLGPDDVAAAPAKVAPKKRPVKKVAPAEATADPVKQAPTPKKAGKR